jgi:hypothetical protein
MEAWLDVRAQAMNSRRSILGSIIVVGSLPSFCAPAEAGLVLFPAEELANKYVLVGHAMTTSALFDPCLIIYA